MKINFLNLVRHKFLYFLLGLVFILLVYRDYITTYLFFDVNAPDLANFDGTAIKNELLRSNLDINVLLFNVGFYQSFLLPIIISLLGFNYVTLKTKFIKLSIGKNDCYFKFRKHLSWQLASLPVLLYLIIVGIVVIITMLAGTFQLSGKEHLLSETSVLRYFLNSDLILFIFSIILVCVAIFVNSLFLFKIIDVLQNPIKSAIDYLMFIWLGSIILYHFMPFYLVPMTTFMITSYGNLDIQTLLLPYCLYMCGYAILKKYEDEI
ncbi:hypothetical protein [Streptococcus sp. S784/96/1]|uniref:hypothetical protein n=1 Tax=Streptococcus sp. S784/96/1 TaxID=2653499 RepID=UPI001386EB79|nr:hypothetical protein [Streptococcus sp. S784/96/1]